MIVLVVVVDSPDRTLAAADRALVRRAARGDPEAMQRLVERHRPVLHAVARRYGRSGVDEEDLVGEVAVTLLADDRRLLREYEPRRPFAALVFTIGLRTARRMADRAAREQPAAVRDLPEEFEPCLVLRSPASPEADLLRNEDRRAVREAFARLSERDRRVLVLRCVAELPYRDVAGVLGVAEGTARKRVFDALRRLRGILEERAPQVFEQLGSGETQARPDGGGRRRRAEA